MRIASVGRPALASVSHGCLRVALRGDRLMAEGPEASSPFAALQVHHLERQAQLAAEAIQPIQLRWGTTTENPCGPGAVGDQRRGFAVTLFQVSLEALRGVEAEEPLLHLTIRQIHDHAAEQLHHLKVIEVGEVPAGLRKQKITGQNSNTRIKAAMDGVHTTTGGRLIDHVIVNERGRMNHLGDLGQASMPWSQLAISGQCAGQQ